MLEITNLRKRYDGFALGPIDLTLEPGTVHGLIGPNGAGKTTLYRAVMGTVRRDQGLVKVGGRPADASSGVWKRKIGYVGDYTPLFEHWSGARNLTAFAAFYDAWSAETAESRASRLELDLSQKAGAYTLMAFTVVQRRREIGVRSALGASPLRLVLGIFRRVLVPVWAGVALGGLTALLLDFYLSPLLFPVREGGRPLPWILPAAEAFILLVGVIAVFGPTRRALRVDSVEALREG